MRLIPQIVGVLLLLGVAVPAHAELDLEAALAERVMGDSEAPVTIIEYASLTCPHCAAFHSDVLMDLKEQYIDTGKVKLIYRDFPLDQRALMASMLARCAGEDRYFGFIDVLYRAQDNWSRARDVNKALAQIGRLGGLSADDLDACLKNEELADGILRMRQQGSQDHNVTSTPSFVINGETHAGNMPIEELAKIIDPLIPTN